MDRTDFMNRVYNLLSDDTDNIRANLIIDDADEYAADYADEYAEEVIKALPSVQPKHGHWILDRSGAYCCSECMEPCASYIMMKPRDRFCKMCGAKMER